MYVNYYGLYYQIIKLNVHINLSENTRKYYYSSYLHKNLLKTLDVTKFDGFALTTAKNGGNVLQESCNSYKFLHHQIMINDDELFFWYG